MHDPVPAPKITISSRAPTRADLLYNLCIKMIISGQTEGGSYHSDLKMFGPQLKIRLEMKVSGA